MAGSEHGHSVRVLLHPLKCGLPGDFYAGLGWACVLHSARIPFVAHFADDSPARGPHGCTTALLSDCGCTRLWTTWTANKHGGPAHPVVLGNSLTMVSTLS